METQRERLEAKLARAKWPDDIPVPATKPKLRLSGADGNAFAILGAAQRAGRRAEWTEDQLKAFNTLATSGDYNFVLQTCMRYFDVS